MRFICLNSASNYKAKIFLFRNHSWWRFREPILFDNSPFDSCNLMVRFSTKQRFFLSQYIYKLKMRSIYIHILYRFSLYIYSELCVCPNVQERFNSEPTTTERCKVKCAIYIYSKPYTFPNLQMWHSNVAATTEFFNKRCVIFLQFFKYTNVVLTCDHHVLTMNTWFFYN